MRELRKNAKFYLGNLGVDKVGVKEIGSEGGDWIHLAQVRIALRALGKTVISIQVLD
jgi:hypothetical protein